MGKKQREVTKDRYQEEDVDLLPEDFGKPVSEEEKSVIRRPAQKRQEVRQGSYAGAVSQAVPHAQVRSGNGAQDKKSKSKHTLRKLAKLAAVMALVLFGIAYAGVRFYVAKMNYQPYETAYVRPADVYKERGVTNLLLVGTDERHSGDTERSDTMIILSINSKKHRLVMTSVLRDSYVEIPGYGAHRLNAAYQYGGADLLIQTIEQNFKVAIDAYAKVDFYSFVDIVDAVGGVSIDVDEGERNYVNGYLNEINALLGAPEGDGYLTQTGVQLLNGKQALSYARIRYIGTDFQRTERQREILQGVVANSKNIRPSALLTLLDQVLPQITTNMTEHRMTMMILKSILYMGYDQEQNRVPMDGTWWDEIVDGQEVLGMDLEANRQGIRTKIYGSE